MKFIIFITLSTIVAGLGISVNASFLETNEQVPGAFVQNVSGARPLGLNGAYVAVADDANAIWWNPAGISQLKRSFFTSMYANLYDVDGLSMSSTGFAKPTEFGVFGLGITYMRASDIPITDMHGNILENSSQYENIFTLSYGNSIFDKLQVGTNVRYLHSGQIVDSSGFSVDFGLLANPIRKFYFGAMLQQMISYLRVENERENLPRNIKTAVAFNTEKLSASLGLDNLLSSHYREFCAGCEVFPCRYIALRTGLRTRVLNDTNISWSVGIGLILKRIQFDYAYVNQPSLASNHLISISLF